MTGFLHGEVSWAAPPGDVADNVRRMADRVAHYPWASTDVDDLSTEGSACVLAVQRLDGADPRHPAELRHDAQHVVADLRLHERDELAASLAIPRADAADRSDESLVLDAYARWGLGFAERLLGDGVVALWDGPSRRLVCWRDAAGVRPLYYHHSPGRGLVISSDLQSMVAHPAVDARLDLPYTRGFLDDERFQHPVRTFVDGVRKLPSGHLLLFDRAGLRIQRYWDPTAVDERDRTDGECVEELREMLERSIRCRLPADGTGAGAHLSGGLDSSSVAVVAARILAQNGRALTGYSWAPPPDLLPRFERDERDLVEAVAQSAGIELRYTRLTPSDVTAFSYRDTALRPRTTLNFEMGTNRLMAADGVRTVLSGWGGDELIAFNGRGYFADLARRGHLATIQRELRSRSALHGGSVRGAWRARVLRPLVPDALRRTGGPPARALPAELRPEFVRLLAEVEPLVHTFPRERPGVHRMQVELLEFGHLQFRMEAWAGHGASRGLTYAFPLLDRRLMELALSLPGRMFFRDGWKRWLYRTAMEGTLPDAVRWNPDKYDSAAAWQLQEVLLEDVEQYRQPLLERKGNPLVDVDVLLAEQERQQQVRARGETPESFVSSSIGAGAWLAFTELRP